MKGNTCRLLFRAVDKCSLKLDSIEHTYFVKKLVNDDRIGRYTKNMKCLKIKYIWFLE